MRTLVTALFAVPLLLAACGDHQDISTGPATVPDVAPAMTVVKLRSAAIDPHSLAAPARSPAFSIRSTASTSPSGVKGF